VLSNPVPRYYYIRSLTGYLSHALYGVRNHNQQKPTTAENITFSLALIIDIAQPFMSSLSS
jgi:hypothetical protein